MDKISHKKNYPIMLMGQLTYVHFYQTIQFKKCKIPILREYKIADT